MNIYDIGVEKCINGVYGREVNGRFYNLIVQENKLGRLLDVDTDPAVLIYTLATLVEHNGVTHYTYEEAVNSSMLFYKFYPKPKHIRDLENLKRGDIVWVKVPSPDGAPNWASTRFIRMHNETYITGDFFKVDGSVHHRFTSNHPEVFLKPPFDF